MRSTIFVGAGAVATTTATIAPASASSTRTARQQTPAPPAGGRARGGGGGRRHDRRLLSRRPLARLARGDRAWSHYQPRSDPRGPAVASKLVASVAGPSARHH